LKEAAKGGMVVEKFGGLGLIPKTPFLRKGGTGKNLMEGELRIIPGKKGVLHGKGGGEEAPA